MNTSEQPTLDGMHVTDRELLELARRDRDRAQVEFAEAVTAYAKAYRRLMEADRAWQARRLAVEKALGVELLTPCCACCIAASERGELPPEHGPIGDRCPFPPCEYHGQGVQA